MLGYRLSETTPSVRIAHALKSNRNTRAQESAFLKRSAVADMRHASLLLFHQPVTPVCVVPGSEDEKVPLEVDNAIMFSAKELE